MPAPRSPDERTGRPPVRERTYDPTISCRPAIVFLASVLLTTACNRGAEPVPSRPDDDVITVGSFDFAESVVVAEVYSQALEAAGYTVHRAFRLGPREFVGPALSSGLIDFLAEYAGTAAQFYSVEGARPSDDVAATHVELEHALDGRHITALASAPAQDANTFVVTAATASRFGLAKLSDLAPVAGRLRFGGPPECPTRPYCLEGLASVYGLTFGEVVTLDAGGPLTRQALNEGLVDVALLFTTDPAIVAGGLVELADDRGLQPAENITPLVRTEVVDRWGAGVVTAIDSVSAKLTTAVVRHLNAAAAMARADPAAVARDWLASVGT